MSRAESATLTAYHRMVAAVSVFHKSFGQLTESEKIQLENIVASKMHIENQVLATPLAQEFCPAEHEIQGCITDIRERYDSEEAFTRDLAQHQLSYEQLMRGVCREEQLSRTLAAVSDTAVPPSDHDIEMYYYMNTERFRYPELREARHILITVNEDFSENTRDQALRKAEQIRQRLVKKPERFEEQALKHSECPSSMEGGFLGKVQAGMLYPELDQCLFEQQVGDISPVLSSELGFHILQCQAVYMSYVLPLDEVQEKIADFLLQRRRQVIQKQWLQELTTDCEADRQVS